MKKMSLNEMKSLSRNEMKKIVAGSGGGGGLGCDAQCLGQCSGICYGSYQVIGTCRVSGLGNCLCAYAC